jgi:hypothetical protein
MRLILHALVLFERWHPCCQRLRRSLPPRTNYSTSRTLLTYKDRTDPRGGRLGRVGLLCGRRCESLNTCPPPAPAVGQHHPAMVWRFDNVFPLAQHL